MYSSCPPIQCDADYCPNNRNSPQACASPKICGKGRCICDFNTKRDRLTGRCIPIKNCPPFPCDRPNEIYDSCPPVCPGQTCTDFINNTTCPRFRIGIVVPCKPACRCIDGFYRDKAGYCISGQMCKESCRGDSNAVPGCGNNCGRRCSDLVTPRPICILSCDLDGCNCKDGFYYDSNKNYCVSPDKCTSICTEPNEVYDKCPDCSPQTCATRDKIYNCPLIPANKIGPNSSPICQIGEFYDNCPQFECEGEYCPANRDSPQTCPTPIICGRGRCVCNFNSKRDRSTGLCIPIRNCPPFACDKPNEVYDSCPPECPGQKCTDFLNNATCPKYPTDNTVPCSPECRCKEGYYRDSNNNCVCAQNCKAERAAQTCDDVEGDRLALIQGSNNFTTKFLYELVNMNPETSVIASPASVLTPLAELALYAQGPTFTQIIAILNLQTKEQIRCAFKAFLDTFQATQDTELDLANKIYVNDEYKLSESFQNDAMTIFDAEAEAIDFENPSQAAGEINEWVSEQTKGKITNLVSSDMFDSLTRLVLVNAVYFKGTWKTKFDPNKTESTDFYVNPSKTIQIQMMQLKTEMKYANNNDLDAQIIELPYLDENITLLVIVPNQKFGLLDVIIQLQNLTILNIVLNDFTLQTVTLFLPKINVSTTIDLEKNLKQDGVETVFTPCAELSGITVPDESLYVSTAIQKATIDINEEGSVAAATNGNYSQNKIYIFLTEFKKRRRFSFCLYVRLRRRF
ncbi:unnamed protein product [Diatraea saccharalis]|uniref:Serpin domain-containing protein n=1 Tax=Diatraea saccharalis TaxID=40085 RepID=A0A9N9QX97_9NEOP|nr:unnamed protein product [Diatraea saccharalis]